MDTKAMLYEGEAVIPALIPRKEWDSLVLDAKRIMGTEPALSKSGVAIPSLSHKPLYLEPPAKGSSAWEYAQRILSLELEWPIYEVRGWKVVGANELEEIAPALIRRELC